MQCTQCGYALWNIRPGACPECGKHFRVTDYRLPDNAVAFQCSLCKHANRPGMIDERGLPIPKQFRCKGCNEYIEVNQTTVIPDDPRTLAHTGSLPWAERNRLGLLQAWRETAWLAIAEPRNLGRTMPPGASTGQPWLFLLINFGLYLAISLISYVVSYASMAVMWGDAWWSGEMMIGMLFGSLYSLVPALIGFPLMAACFAVVTQMVLVVTGGSKSFDRTMAAVSFSSTAVVAGALLGAIPCIGSIATGLGWLCWFVFGGILIMEIHVVDGWRAALAAVLGPICGVVLCCAGGGIFGGAIFSAVMPALTTATMAGLASQTLVSDSYLEHIYSDATAYRADNGRWPKHVFELLVDEPMNVLSLDNMDSLFYFDSVEAGLSDNWWEMDAKQRVADMQRIIDATPDDIEAHRFAFVVFTWHGLPAQNPDAGLWLAVTADDPNAAMTMHAGVYTVSVLKADGRVETFEKKDLPGKLNDQNALRQKLNLPLVPAPSKVVHIKPDEAESSDAEPVEAPLDQSQTPQPDAVENDVDESSDQPTFEPAAQTSAEVEAATVEN